MNLKWYSPPIAGKNFSFMIEHSAVRVETSVYLDEQLVFTSECPDPPCHEVFSVPKDAAKHSLELIVRDGNKIIYDKRFVIKDSFKNNLNYK